MRKTARKTKPAQAIRDNVIQFPVPKRFQEELPKIESNLFDVNEYVTGGNEGFTMFILGRDAEEFGLSRGDFLFIDTSRIENEPESIFYGKVKSRWAVGMESDFRPGQAIGVVTHILRRIER